MPRRRLLDPSFTDDVEVAQLTRDERLFLVGCLRNADDEGRFSGHRVYLKSEIFMYDEDIDLKRMQEIRNSTLDKMSRWRPDNIWLLLPYQNSGIDYLYFPNWFAFNKPSHPTPSKLPAPPARANSSGEAPEILQSNSREVPEVLPNASALSQVRSSQVRVGKVRGVQEDFRKYLDSEKDLTDFLTTTLQKYLPRGPAWAVDVLNKLWEQALGEPMKQPAFEVTLEAVKRYSAVVLAKSYAKAVKYRGGKYAPAKYLEKILKEKGEQESQSGGRGPPA
ncbi:hypothetical protein ES708_00264 [subsurface metagenome]